jgi:hypothetical protein
MIRNGSGLAFITFGLSHGVRATVKTVRRLTHEADGRHSSWK